MNEDREDMPEEFTHLEGQPIHIGAASRKYKIANATISRWVTKGLIDVIGYAGQKKLIDAAQMAWRAKQYEEGGGGQGKRIFQE